MAKKGEKLSSETREKMSIAHKGKIFSQEHKDKIRQHNIDHPRIHWLGKKFSDEHRKKLSEAKKGKKLSCEHKEKIGESLKGKSTASWTPKGENHHAWIKDRTLVIEKHRLRGTQEWKNWRNFIFTRDKYTCKECNITGNHLEPHHIIPIRSDMNKLFDVNNGITLCRPCHQKTIWKEFEFQEKYQMLVLT